MTATADPKESTEEKEEAGAGKTSGRLGIRHLQAVLLFLGMIIGYCLRICMSEAAVAMSTSSKAHPGFPSYNWTEADRSLIHSSFFWGYTITQVPSGYLASIWSGQRLLSLGMLICGALNLLVPLAASYGDKIAVCACRMGMGLTQACLLPCVHMLLSRWVPPSERARLGTFVYAGAQLGTVLAFPISGFLADSDAGWPSIFYFFGALGIVWGVGFYFAGSDTPSAHPTISDQERSYIEDSLNAVQGIQGDAPEGKLKTPWLEIFSSAPMWALIIAHCGQNWGYWTLLNQMPSYMSKILEFDIKQNGGVSALPYLAMWLLSFPVSWLSDYALTKGVSRTLARKTCNTIAYWGPAIALFCLAYVPTDSKIVTVAILVVAVGLNAGSLCGYQINHIDLSPNYAGTMMSITNCLASVVAIVAPLICGQIVQNEKDASQWATVFCIAAAIYFFGNLVFIIFGKAEVQWWNDPQAVKSRRHSRKRSVIA